MRLITGYLTLLCFLLMALKYPLRKLHLDKANAFLMKLHEAASAGMLLGGIVHMILAIPALKTLGALVGISGFVSLALCVIIITACHLTKNVTIKMSWHRWLSLALALAVVTHIAAFVF